MNSFSPLAKFELASLPLVPNMPGVYLIYDQEGPVYGGRSKNLRRRLRQHLLLSGSAKVAELIQAGKALRLSFLSLDITEIREVEAALIPYLRLTQFANLIHAGLYEDDVGTDPTFDRPGGR